MVFPDVVLGHSEGVDINGIVAGKPESSFRLPQSQLILGDPCPELREHRQACVE
jgi:hypothetical protein